MKNVPTTKTSTNPTTAAVVVEPIESHASVDAATVIFSHATRPAILETSLRQGPYARYSILAADPAGAIVYERNAIGCPFRHVQMRMAQYPTVPDNENALPFTGGWIGHISYEAGLRIEGIRCTTLADGCVPLVDLRLYDSAAVFDHTERQWYAIAVDWPPLWTKHRPSASDRLARIQQRLFSAQRLDSSNATRDNSLRIAGVVQPNMSDEAYWAKLRRTKRYIEAGDVFQVNLTRRFSVETEDGPLEIYRRLRRVSPSSHAALIYGQGYAIISSSPELFLDVRGNRVVTRPIKGTRPRLGDRLLDESARCDLAESEKDRAELNMIIDLLRNDLGRVCRYGSIRVVADGEIEAHPTVYHRVATIEGELDAGRTVFDLLRATLPGGSVTGAPKIRAVQIIDELEPTERGVYCGSIGYFGLDGSVSLNIAIRTIVHSGGCVHLYAGGAIVADSDPQSEHEEIMAKARGMFQALNCRSVSVERQQNWAVQW